MGHVCASLLAVSPEPFLPLWNLRLLRGLFHLLPHTAFRDSLAQFFVDNPLPSTFVFAAAFYVYWRIADDRALWRRTRLGVLALVLSAVSFVTLGLRPWIGWPAPVLALRFRDLYPQELWSEGNANCFPSHSTFIYLLIALALWPFNRKLSALLAIWVAVAISLPRIYVGGHYPVDILAGVVLAGLSLCVMEGLCRFRPARSKLERIASAGLWVEVLLLFWLFEVAEGFRSSFWILSIAAQAVENLWKSVVAK
jgi:membrane-associated phospholipid phosphatase